MAKRRRRDLAVGVLFSLALTILALAVMAVGGESRLFVKKAYYTVTFPSADGLVVGSPVKMSGVVVGTVSAIRLAKEPQRAGIQVEVGVDRDYAARVRQDSRAALRILQILSGEKFVEIIPGSPGSPPLEESSELEVEQAQELLEQAAVTTENVNEITISLRNVLGALERGEGLMGQMITDPEFGQEGLAALRGAFENLRAITGDLKRGRGFIGRLLTDETFAQRVDELAGTLQNLSAVLERVDADQGAIGALLAEDGAGEQAVEDLRDAAGSLKRVTAALESETGLLGRLLNDEAYSEQLAQDLGTITANLAEISHKLNSGRGTLGALINERTLHDGMEDVVVGVNDSKFARWLIRRYQKKGIKIDDSAPPVADEPTGP